MDEAVMRGDVFLKIAADQRRTGVEVQRMAPVPTTEILWRTPLVLALAALPGAALDRLGEPSTAPPAAWAAANLEYGLGSGRYDLSCGTFTGHHGLVSGTQSIALISDENPAGVVLVFNLVDDNDPGLLALAESMVCSGT